MSYIENFKIVPDANYVAHSLSLIESIRDKKYDEAIHLFEEKFIVPLFVYDNNKNLYQVENLILKTILTTPIDKKALSFIDYMVNNVSLENRQFIFLEIVRLDLNYLALKFSHLEEDISIDNIKDYLSHWNQDVLTKSVENLLIQKEKFYLNQSISQIDTKTIKKI